MKYIYTYVYTKAEKKNIYIFSLKQAQNKFEI